MRGACITCVGCQQNATQESGTIDGTYRLVSCTTCGLAFAYPRPSLAELRKVYEPAMPCVFGNHNSGEAKEVGSSYHALIKRYGNPGKRVLEVGCNTGFALHGLEQFGYDVTGSDLSGAAIGYGREHFKLRQLYCAEFPPDELARSFDVLIASHIIEHVIDPVQFVKRCLDFLKPDGLFIVHTPNVRSVGIRLLKTSYPVFCPPVHLNYFSISTLTALLEKHFQIVASYTHSDWRDTRNTVFNSLVSVAQRVGIKKRLKSTVMPSTAGNGQTHTFSTIRTVTQTTQRLLWPLFSTLDKAGLGENMTIVARKI